VFKSILAATVAAAFVLGLPVSPPAAHAAGPCTPMNKADSGLVQRCEQCFSAYPTGFTSSGNKVCAALNDTWGQDSDAPPAGNLPLGSPPPPPGAGAPNSVAGAAPTPAS
jgi:hypothetical protein